MSGAQSKSGCVQPLSDMRARIPEAMIPAEVAVIEGKGVPCVDHCGRDVNIPSSWMVHLFALSLTSGLFARSPQQMWAEVLLPHLSDEGLIAKLSWPNICGYKLKRVTHSEVSIITITSQIHLLPALSLLTSQLLQACDGSPSTG